MSLHNNKDSDALKTAMVAHGLKTNSPSQLSDAFRLGWIAHLSADKLAAAEKLAEAVKALSVFSDCADLLDDETKETGREYPDDEWAKFRLLVSDYRNARAALRALSENPHE